ncbi:MAG: DUF58 domain-containing protein [Acidimicrobiia bacterium]|nr:DUF58 domain-containing protein [Acidimicrobiia bacterium]
MPTVRGWAAVGAAAALVVLWVAFGERLLLAVALFLGFAVAFGLIHVRRTAPQVSITRTLAPPTINDGGRVLVDVHLDATRRIRHVIVEDEVTTLGAARFIADRVQPGDTLAGRYEVMCRPRGLYRVGPANVTVRDPLGLTEAGGPVGVASELVVYPALEELDGLPAVRGQDPTVRTARANHSHTGGEDFFTLREYQQGDDIRHVHWPSSARRDVLMIKQLEMPWQSRGLILFDTRREVYPSDDDFERAVIGAASVLKHLFANGFGPTLWTGDESALVADGDAFTNAMRTLAIITPTERVDLASSIARLRRSNVGGGLFIMVTGAGNEGNLAAYRLLSRDFSRTVILAAAQQPSDDILKLRAAGAVTVSSAPGSTWAPSWHSAMEGTWSTATAG